MAKRNKQNKPCPAPHCKFPTKNRQSPLHRSQLKEIATVAPDAWVRLAEGHICSYCGCVYTYEGKHKTIVGYHDDPRMEDTEHEVWWEVDDNLVD